MPFRRAHFDIILLAKIQVKTLHGMKNNPHGDGRVQKSPLSARLVGKPWHWQALELALAGWRWKRHRKHLKQIFTSGPQLFFSSVDEHMLAMFQYG